MLIWTTIKEWKKFYPRKDCFSCNLGDPKKVFLLLRLTYCGEQVRSNKAKKSLLYLSIRMGKDVVKIVFFKFDPSFNHSYLSIRMGEVMKKYI